MLDIRQYVSRRVVLDTSSSMIYIGRLEACDDRGYWLADADVHDRHDGHSTKEEYINEAHELDRSGTRRINRKRVFVERHAVISVSALEDVAAEEQDDRDDNGRWVQ